MNTTNYEKPKMKFVSLRNKKEVAERCWGGAGTTDTWYYDTQGPGYVSFQISDGSCDLRLTNVKYYDKQDSEGQIIDTDDSKYVELYNVLLKAQGEKGTPFKGIELNFPDNPNPKWS